MVRLKNKHKLDNNTVIHQMIIVAQFLKRYGKGGVTKNLGLPERVISLPREYGDADLKKFFDACTPAERALFSTFLFTGFREQGVVHLFWSDVNFRAQHYSGHLEARPRLLAEALRGTRSSGFQGAHGSPHGSPAKERIADFCFHPRRESRMAYARSMQGHREACEA